MSVDLNYRPDTHRFFTKEQYEDYFSSVTWVSDVAPREHDATCLALTMRLRAGRHRGDIFQCGYIFATRNPRFVQHSRQYCLSSKLLYETQENAVIHQRELATVAWLRTGLGVAERIPRGQLMAACDRVLRVRTEVRDAVAARLRMFDWIGTGAVLLIALGAISNYVTGWLTSSPFWSIWVAGGLGLFAVYHGTMNALERPKVGLVSLLNLVARVLFKRRLANAQLSDMIVLERVESKNGRITVPPDAFRQAS